MSKSKFWDGAGDRDREASIIGPNPFKILADLGAMALCPLPLGLLLIYTYLLILGDCRLRKMEETIKF